MRPPFSSVRCTMRPDVTKRQRSEAASGNHPRSLRPLVAPPCDASAVLSGRSRGRRPVPILRLFIFPLPPSPIKLEGRPQARQDF
ncbi:hypothetical protein PUN4_860005 [Paraburkholderia unamae]|nr:hypothetical protein PUN4_860005 [Paraburkholderia unamae]